MNRDVRDEVDEYLLGHRDEDVSPLVQTIVRLDEGATTLVGLRNHGREAIVVDRGLRSVYGVWLVALRVEPFPRGTSSLEMIDLAEDVQEWVTEHPDEFCWVHPRWRDGE